MRLSALIGLPLLLPAILCAQSVSQSSKRKHIDDLLEEHEAKYNVSCVKDDVTDSTDRFRGNGHTTDLITDETLDGHKKKPNGCTIKR